MLLLFLQIIGLYNWERK